jgi:hypothetical protein
LEEFLTFLDNFIVPRLFAIDGDEVCDTKIADERVEGFGGCWKVEET